MKINLVGLSTTIHISGISDGYLEGRIIEVTEKLILISNVKRVWKGTGEIPPDRIFLIPFNIVTRPIEIFDTKDK